MELKSGMWASGSTGNFQTGNLVMKKTALLLSLAALALSFPHQATAESVSAEGGERWGFTVGGFAGFAPVYEGSDKYRFVGYPLIIPKFYGDNHDPLAAPRITFKGIDDVRVSVFRYGAFDAGPVVGYHFGRDEDDADRLAGIGDIDGGFNVGGFAALRMAPFLLDLAYVQQVTGSGDLGHTIRLGAGWEDQISEPLTVSAYLSGVYASEDYMDAHFSVSAAQAMASVAGLPAFDAEAGFKNVGLELGADYKLSERWAIRGKLGYSRLLGDAAISPITAAKDQFSGGFGLTYTFGRTR